MPGKMRGLFERMHSWVPFGLGKIKPRHYREMFRILWENRRHPWYAWKVLSQGVCDGCALGTSGLRDWTIEGTHLCLVRLNLLKLNTMDPFDPRLLADLSKFSAYSSKQLRDLGRLGFPMRRRKGEPGFTQISWEQLWSEAGQRWKSYAPETTAMYLTSRGITNEVYYVAQKIMRCWGTNNVDNAARLCHSPSSYAMKSTLGVAATTCSYRDWYETDLIVFFGSNPANDQPVAMKYLYEARKRGVRTLIVNACREPGMQRYWVPSNWDSALFGTEMNDGTYLVKIGSDLAFLNAVARVLLESDGIKSEFIRSSTTGFEAWKENILKQELSELLALCGLKLDEVQTFAQEIINADKAILVWSMGITQHVHGTDTVQAILNLGLLREYVGRDGTGLMPIRGHSGVQGGAEMGAYSTAYPGGLPITAEYAAQFSKLWNFEVPSSPGLTTTQMLDAAQSGKIYGFYCIGGNFLETMPQPGQIASALSKIPLRLHSDIVLTRQMFIEPEAVDGAVYLLPAKTRYEQTDGGTETSTERRVIFSPCISGHPVGEACSEWELLLDFGKAILGDKYAKVHFTSGAAIRQEIEKAVPMYQGISRLQKQGDQFQIGGRHLCANRKFQQPDGKARFHPVTPPGLGETSVFAANEFKLATRRGKQFNSMIQAPIDALTGAARDHVFIAPQDADRLHLKMNARIVLKNEWGVFHGRVFIADVTPGSLQAHWPEANCLIALGRYDTGAGVPDYNAVVTLEPET